MEVHKQVQEEEGEDRGKNTIELESWESHFMDLLGGTKRRVVLNQAEEEKEESERKEEEVEDITKEELAAEEIEKGKGSEGGIENEAWRYMSMEVGEVFWKLIKNIWRKEGVPEDWNKGINSPIYKTGEKKEVRNYRGVILMDITYKIYASILNEKLIKAVDNKLHETQFGFRIGRGVMDAVYVLNYIINKELSKKEGKIFVFFANLKVAFDKIDRKKLNKIMEKIGMENNLKRRIMETYRETVNVVKVGDRKTEEF